ncbi:hypothetical protein CF66_2356 [Candidatus Photodesmus katoptron]|uniref:ATPase involved in DNA repair n=1 Tax=Candidatus Photodesmus katoptron Akat1 TaxID=1236703 RepID=S3E0A4_9GAMM|nr:hypothetical protein [Candidatus Photodesmus katoptron]EPE37626.1 ATPase involved in DNA repair [Candidatus Photodesmus katoptron Akat1]KEY90655.1 hypothetical protein CF66_2356 [Candidatus Photodesmus katoptron]
MNIGLVITLIAVLLILVFSYNIIVQYKLQIDKERQKKSNRYVAIIEATKELLQNTYSLPFSKELVICLNKRIFYSLKNMLELTPKNKNLNQYIINLQKEINHIEHNYKSSKITSFKIPDDEKQVITILKLVKRLRDIIRSENNKGYLQTKIYISENAKLELLQTRISIESLIKRINSSINRKQIETAIHLINTGISSLNSKNDVYSNQVRIRLQDIFSKLDSKRQEKNSKETVKHLNRKERENELNILFGKKKKW